METTVKKLIAKTLDLLHKNGMSKKTLWMYKHYGFEPILHHFYACEIEAYCQTEAFRYLNKMHDEHQAGRLSVWRWRHMRKAFVFLNSANENGTIDTTPLLAWRIENNPLHAQPTEKQLATADNMVVLVSRVKQALADLGLSKNSLKNYTYCGFDPLLRFCKVNHIERYDKQALQRFAAIAEERYTSGEISKNACQKARKVILLLGEYLHTGTIKWRHQPRIGTRVLCDDYAEIWNAFTGASRGIFTELSLATIRSATHRFMHLLEDMGMHSFSEVSHSTVSALVTQMAQNYTGGKNALLFSLRTFLRFLFESSVIQSDLSEALPDLTAPRRIVQEGFSEEEIEQLLDCVDTDQAIGKRNYAIIVIAVQTGLRAVDIRNLKRENIDWHMREIRIVQHKTKRALSLPLMPATGNAIAAYLLYGRPDSPLPDLFLCHGNPVRPMGAYAISNMISEQMIAASISSHPRRGAHSFRRAFGRRLLVSETSSDMLSELLGHSNRDSAKPYLATNLCELKKCAISLSDIEKVGEVL